MPIYELYDKTWIMGYVCVRSIWDYRKFHHTQEKGAEIRQLPCDLWELPTSEQETSGHFSKWKGQLADLKDYEHPRGGDIPVKHLHLPAKPGRPWSTNGTRCALPKPSPNTFTGITFLQDGFCLSIKLLFPSSLSFCACSPPHECIPIIKKEECTAFPCFPGKERSCTAQNICQSFLFQRHKLVWFPGTHLPGKKGVKRVLAHLPSPWAAAAHGSTSPLQDSWLFSGFSHCELGSHSLLTVARKKK